MHTTSSTGGYDLSPPLKVLQFCYSLNFQGFAGFRSPALILRMWSRIFSLIVLLIVPDPLFDPLSELIIGQMTEVQQPFCCMNRAGFYSVD
jgi:hypothetical protein